MRRTGFGGKTLPSHQPMDDFFQHITEPWALRALMASSMVGIMCGLLGCFLVLRNMALVGDALSHAILPGVVLAFVFVRGHSTLGFFAGATLAGIFSAVVITWIQRHVETKNDAAIGIVFTAMFSAGVIGISHLGRQPGVHLDLKDFLFGNVLGVGPEDLWLTLAILGYVLISMLAFYRYLFATTFQPVVAQTMGIPTGVIHYFLMLLLSFAVVASLQTVGVILVVAMLVTPAATALLLFDRLVQVLVAAALLGWGAAVIGLSMAILLETTPGPAMALTATFFYLFAVFFAPRKGLVFRYVRNRGLKGRIRTEDALKQAFRLEEEKTLTASRLARNLDLPTRSLRKVLHRLRTKGWLHHRELSLTDSGREEARRLVRAHRLWESYLVSEIGLSTAHIHAEAEKFEHLLTEDILEEVDKTLGYPRTDPHGSPIPARPGMPALSLVQLQAGETGLLTPGQVPAPLLNKLVRNGMNPDLPFALADKEEEYVTLRQQSRVVRLPVDLARRIQVTLAQPPKN
ncbi:MAG: Manganese transport system rane protein MntB [Bacteroidota bacterium]